MNEPVFDKTANTGIRHLINATKFSFQGLISAAQRESAFRQELVISIPILASGAWLAQSGWEVLALFSAVLLVLVVELLNSGIEAAVDRSGVEFNEFARLAKDYGSAAVMLAIFIPASIWVYILYRGLISQ